MSCPRRSLKVESKQQTLDECFLAKFKCPTPKKMPSLGMKIRKTDDDDDDVENSPDPNANVVSVKRPSTPPESPFKRQRTSLRPSPSQSRKSLRDNFDGEFDDDDDDDNNNKRRVVAKNRLPSKSPAKNPSGQKSNSAPQSSAEKRKSGSTRSSPRKADSAKDGYGSSDSSSDSDNDADVEALRRRNIEDNHRFLAELEIQKTKDQIQSIADSPLSAKRRDVKGLKRTSVAKSPPAPRRVSLRQRRIDSDGVALAPNYKEPSESDIRRGLASAPTTLSFSASSRSFSSLGGGGQTSKRSGRKPTTPLEMAIVLDNGPDEELDEEDLTSTRMSSDEEAFRKEMEAKRKRKEEKRKEGASRFISDMIGFVKRAKEPTSEEQDFVKGKTEASFLKQMKKLRLTEALERKVTKERIFGMGIHPSVEKTLIAVGDKWGGVGLWDVDDADIGEDGVHLFHPHSNPINVLRWAPESDTAAKSLFTCSYDGTIRRGDFEKETFECVFASEDENLAVSAFAFTSPHTLVASDLSGGVSFVDTRVDGLDAVSSYQVHPKSCRNVDVHPADCQYFVTSGTEGNVFIWDARNMSKNPKPVVTMCQTRSVNSAYFSPVTGNQILTTGMDDFYRIYDFSDKKTAPVAKDLRHNNNTGRWITKFRAVWYPRREDFILSGLMGHPRQIELYSSTSTPKKLEKVHEYKDPDILGSICCVIQGHPYKPLLAGANASGKVYVFQ